MRLVDLHIQCTDKLREPGVEPQYNKGGWTQTSGAWWPHRPSVLQRVTYATVPPGQA